MSGRKKASNVLLVAGYALAGWAGAHFVPMWRDRRVGRFVAFEAGTAMVTAGLVLRRRPLPAAANGATLVGLAVAWLVSASRRP